MNNRKTHRKRFIHKGSGATTEISNEVKINPNQKPLTDKIQSIQPTKKDAKVLLPTPKDETGTDYFKILSGKIPESDEKLNAFKQLIDANIIPPLLISFISEQNDKEQTYNYIDKLLDTYSTIKKMNNYVTTTQYGNLAIINEFY